MRNLRPNQGIQIPKDGVKSAVEQSTKLEIPIPDKKSKPRRQVLLGKLPQKQPADEEEDMNGDNLTIERFECLYWRARMAGEEELLDEKFFTKPGKKLNLFNFIKGADPEQVYEAFQNGLVRLIYPSQNLKEVRQFPKEIYRAIKKFRTKVLKNDKDIFLKVQSSIPIWGDEDEVICQPFHIIQIGISSGEKCTPSVPAPCHLNKVDFRQFGLKKLEEFLHKAFSFTKDDKVFVNQIGINFLIFSQSLKQLSAQHEDKILSFQQIFASGRYVQKHDKRVCPTVRKKTMHYCNVCSEKRSGPFTEEEEKQPTQKRQRLL